MSVTHDRQTLFASAARGSGANNSAKLANPCFRGAKFYLDVTAVTGTNPTLDVKIQAFDPVSGQYIDIANAAFAQKTGASTAMLTVYPGIATSANVAVSDVMPANYRAVATVGGTNTPTVTFSLTADLLL